MSDVKAMPVETFSAFVRAAERRAHERLGAAVSGEEVAVGLLLRRVHSLMTTDADHEVFRPAGLTVASFRICFALWVDGPLEPHRVAARTALSKAAVSASMKTLLARGLITTAASTTDLRSIVMSLTDAGAELTERTYARHLELTKEWLAPLSGPEQQILAGLLGKVMAGPRAGALAGTEGTPEEKEGDHHG